jgi:thioredoxin-disulfide reductase
MYDLIIIGAGPAGITAAIYAVRKRMDLLVITRDIGGQTNWTLNVENYTGYQLITGKELVKRFKEHLQQFNIPIRQGESVQKVEKTDGHVTVTTRDGVYESRTVIIASGRVPRKLRVPGEDRLRNKGLAYCATCDAPLFVDASVAVVGGGNSALEAALQLVKIAKQVYLIDIAPELRADKVMVEKALASGKMTIMNNTTVKEVRGDQFVSALVVEQNGEAKELAVEGVFVEIGWEPASRIVEGVMKDHHGDIKVNCRCETSIDGIFAAGDVTTVPAKQIIVASGEGAKAAIAAFEYINIHTEKQFEAVAVR